MSSLTTTTINTANGTTNLTVTTGNTSGPAIVVSSNNDVWIRANSSTNSFITNATSTRINTPLIVATNSTFSSNATFNANLTLNANATVNRIAATTIEIVIGSVSTNTFTLGAASIANPGYSRLPNGLLLQWGNTTVNSSVGSVTFPAAFSSVYSMQLTPTVSTVGNTLPAVTSLSTTVAQLRSANATSSTVYWLAIGT